MSSTYSQIYIQVVFAVKGRESLINTSWEEELYKYITGIVTNKGQKMLAINGMPDHLHFLIGMKPNCNLSDLVREIKKASNAFVQEKRFVHGKFQWQEGYGAFSYSHSVLDNVIAYIAKQKEHHKKKSFKEEYEAFLQKFKIEYQAAYLFDWIEWYNANNSKDKNDEAINLRPEGSYVYRMDWKDDMRPRWGRTKQ